MAENNEAVDHGAVVVPGCVYEEYIFYAAQLLAENSEAIDHRLFLVVWKPRPVAPGTRDWWCNGYIKHAKRVYAPPPAPFPTSRKRSDIPFFFERGVVGAGTFLCGFVFGGAEQVLPAYAVGSIGFYL